MINFLFALAGPTSTQAQESPSPIVSLLPILFIFLIFYLLLIRPQQKRQKEHQKMVLNLKKNDEVITIGGIHGTIISVKDKTFVLRVDENVKLEIEKSSIASLKKSRG
jgi:preprotein translocase subunit YajC